MREALDALAGGNELPAAGANGGLAVTGAGQTETRPRHPARTMLGRLDGLFQGIVCGHEARVPRIRL